MINRPNVPTVALPAPTGFLPNGGGPIVHAVPAVASGPMAAAVVTELKKRAAKPANHRTKGAEP
jgi:hypothetical protein